ncbi:pentapeptide repeat-containing protein [uncultured Roseibium sp.]|uniref:pentapeptide repeat-containing protein n=1 Tax=uncultured Roseibium sp. TaxID=1936171 RepID=UPI00262EA7BE|nr:pentapeptide repeat-containing protein [uncultured Roseibium sp.]
MANHRNSATSRWGRCKPRLWAEEKQLSHIAEVSQNARSTWFALMATLLFSAIAVSGVQDRDFFAYDSGLTLPVIGFSVPIMPFFAAGSVIVLGLYVYLHLYLSKLWRALGGVRPKLKDGRYLDDAVFPWLISDAAIFLKPGGPRRSSGRLSVLIAVLFLWVSGPAVLFLFWWRSFPPHILWLTSWTGAVFCLSLASAAASFCIFMRWMRGGSVVPAAGRIWKDVYRVSRALIALVFILIAGAGMVRTGTVLETPEVREGKVVTWRQGWIRIGGESPWVYPASLYRAELVERPSGWLPRAEAEADFLAHYSGEKRKDFNSETDWRQDARDAFAKRRKSLLDGLRAKDFQNRSFRNADAREVFLPGADLRFADFKKAQLDNATLEAADLSGANLQEANLRLANLQEADLSDANLQEANLRFANLQEADLSDANLQEANLRLANLQEADLSGVNLQEANLRFANLQEADLSGVNLQEANLWDANLQEADLRFANLQEANLWDADARNASLQFAFLASVNLIEVQNLTQSQINFAYGDAATALPDHLYRPSYWAFEKLGEEDGERRWRVWFEVQGAKERKENRINS